MPAELDAVPLVPVAEGDELLLDGAAFDRMNPAALDAAPVADDALDAGAFSKHPVTVTECSLALGVAWLGVLVCAASPTETAQAIAANVPVQTVRCIVAS